MLNENDSLEALHDAFDALAHASRKIEELAKGGDVDDEGSRFLQSRLLDVAKYLLDRADHDEVEGRAVFSAVFETIRRRTLAPATRRRPRQR